MRKTIIAAAIALGILSSPYAKEYNLETLKSDLTIEELADGTLLVQAPIVTDYSEVKEIAETLYAKLTGSTIPCKITIMDSASFFQKANESDYLSFSKLEAFVRGGDIYVKQNILSKIILNLGHELGHVSKEKFPHSNLSYKEKMIEEAKAIAFNINWNDELAPYIGKSFCASCFGKNPSKVYTAATELVIQVSANQPDALKGNIDFKKTYQTILEKSTEDLINITKRNKEYQLFEQEQLAKKNPNSVYK